MDELEFKKLKQTISNMEDELVDLEVEKDDAISNLKGKVTHLEGEVECITVQKDEANLLVAELRGRVDRAVKCCNEFMEVSTV